MYFLFLFFFFRFQRGERWQGGRTQTQRNTASEYSQQKTSLCIESFATDTFIYSFFRANVQFWMHQILKRSKFFHKVVINMRCWSVCEKFIWCYPPMDTVIPAFYRVQQESGKAWGIESEVNLSAWIKATNSDKWLLFWCHVRLHRRRHVKVQYVRMVHLSHLLTLAVMCWWPRPTCPTWPHPPPTPLSHPNITGQSGLQKVNQLYTSRTKSSANRKSQTTSLKLSWTLQESFTNM